ncbi:MAG: hypothetical protein A2666_03670 [Parcubacteria group bacterium RIFCSPHIGHO2_01_FULL_47_10b]|nr:MAG: hypothetical protein A2666_03670 [Parcubacteria group bacterium RIFCSPHIGHO2_01_FULL_47_10b]
MEQRDLEDFKAQLLAKRAELEGQLQRLATENPSLKGDYETQFAETAGASLEDEASETEEYINELPVEHALEAKLKRVRSALERIEKETYGMCIKSGKPIDLKRLQAIPETPYCLEVEQELEKNTRT